MTDRCRSLGCRRDAAPGIGYCCDLCAYAFSERGRPADRHSGRCDAAERARLAGSAPSQPVDTSRASARNLDETGRWRGKKRRALDQILARGRHGMTAGEIAHENADDHSNAWAPVLTTLHRAGALACLTATRESPISGMANHVYVGAEHVDGRETRPPIERLCPHCGGEI